MSDYYPIKLTIYQQVKLYLVTRCSTCLKYCSCWCSQETRSLKKLYDSGMKKYETDTRIDAIVKNIKKMKIYLKPYMVSNKLKSDMQFHSKNVIDLDSPIEEEK